MVGVEVGIEPSPSDNNSRTDLLSVNNKQSFSQVVPVSEVNEKKKERSKGKGKRRLSKQRTFDFDQGTQFLTSKKKIDRIESSLDNPSIYYQHENLRSASDNMQNYMDNYGVTFELPSLYVSDAKMYPTDPKYNLQLVNYVFPQNHDYQVETHCLDGKVTVGEFSDLYKNYQRGLVLRMLIRENSALKMVDEVAIDEKSALMKFHQDGTLFAFYFQDAQKLRVIQVDQENVYNFIDQIKNIGEDGYFYKNQYDPNELDLSFIKHIEFDQNRRFFIGYGEQKLFLQNFNLDKGAVFPINSRIYESINCVQFKSSSDELYECYVGCKRSDIKQVCIFDFSEDLQMREKTGTANHGQHLESSKCINFENEVASNFRVQISPDFKQVILANGQENVVLEIYEHYYNQRKLLQLKNKLIHHISIDWEDGGFYILASQDYDKFLSVEHSNRDYFSVRFQRPIEPGIVKIFDFNLKNPIQNKPEHLEGKSKEIRVLSMKDDEFLLDKSVYEEVGANSNTIEDSLQFVMGTQIINADPQQKDIDYSTYIYSPIRAFSFNWPFVAFSGLSNYVLVYDAFNRKMVKRIEIASDNQKITICETYLADNNDLFVVVLDKQYYKIYQIDLDEEYLEVKQILSYSEEIVKKQQITQIHCRGSSRKQKIDLNQKLMIFLLHGDTIYSWVQFDTKEFCVKDAEDDHKHQLKEVCRCSSKFQQLNENQFFFLQVIKEPDSKNIVSQDIVTISIKQVRYQVESVFKEKNVQQERLKTFNIDQEANKLLIMSKQIQSHGVAVKKVFTLKIFCFVDKEIIYEQQINFPHLIGRFKSGLYTFVNGHIYYNNNVIKVRYDLIAKNKNIQLVEGQVFDYYFDCFKLGENEKVKADTPLDSINDHRFGYITSDETATQPKKLILLPYLHERKIYLNKLESSSSCFYTSVETLEEEEEEYHKALERQEDDPLPYLTIKLPVQEIEPRKYVSLGTSLMSVFKKQEDQKEEKKRFTSILAINQDENEYEVYSQNGIKINKIDYTDFVVKYGKPYTTSNSGQYYIFKQSREHLEDLMEKNVPDAEVLDTFFTIHLVRFTVYGVQHIKKINILESMIKCIKAREQKGTAQISYKKFINDNQWLLGSSFQELSKVIDYKYVINDRMDVMIRLRHLEDVENEEDPDQETTYNSIFFYEAAIQQTDDQDDLYVSKSMRNTDFIINKNYLFVWSKKVIWFFDLSLDLIGANMKIINFHIDPEDKMSSIKDIRTGSNPLMIGVIVEQEEIDTIMSWDLITNTETDSIDVADKYIIIWDKVGNPYIVTENQTHFIKQSCAVTCYDIGNQLKDLDQTKSQLKFEKGHRVDANNHNWLIFSEFLSLPFSYMSFVIKDKIENGCELQQENMFDVEPYNYIFNKSTPFNEGVFVCDDLQQLSRVLDEMFIINPSSVEILNYTQSYYLPDDENEHITSALSRAVHSGNNKSVDILLDVLSRTDFNSSRNYKSVFSELIDQKNFKKYFAQIPTQTVQMEKKQVLRAPEKYNDKFVSIVGSTHVYVDDHFYKSEMQESQANSSFPVKVTGLRVGWIINSIEGKDFLKTVLKSEDLELFDIESLQLIIEFLYSKLKIVIFLFVFPIYIASHIGYMNMVQSNNNYINYLVHEHGQKEMVMSADVDSEFKHDLYVASTLNIVVVCIQFSFILLNIRQQKLSFFSSSIYGYLDTIYIIQNFVQYYIIQSSLVTNYTQEQFRRQVDLQRYIGVIGNVTLFVKASYFFSLVDSISPLIDQITLIVYDIKWFMVVMMVYIVMLMECFYLLGQNQQNLDYYDYDHLSVDDPSRLVYETRVGAFWYVVDMVLGTLDATPFTLGDNPSQSGKLTTVYIIGAFIINIHFMNMLIAIMGNTFAERSEVAGKVQIKDHLRFVMDNWSFLNIAFKITFSERKNIEYIIAASQSGDDDDDDQFSELQETVDKICTTMTDQFKKTQQSNRATQMMISEVLKQVKKQQEVK